MDRIHLYRAISLALTTRFTYPEVDAGHDYKPKSSAHCPRPIQGNASSLRLLRSRGYALRGLRCPQILFCDHRLCPFRPRSSCIAYYSKGSLEAIRELFYEVNPVSIACLLAGRTACTLCARREKIWKLELRWHGLRCYIVPIFLLRGAVYVHR